MYREHRELFPREPDQGGGQPLQQVGDGLADLPFTQHSWDIPVETAWGTNWLIAFVLLVAILVLAALAFAFGLAGFIKTMHVDKDVDRLHKNVTGLHSVCQRTDCVGIWSLPISLEGGHCYVLKRNLTLALGDGILIVSQRNIDLCYNNFNILVEGSVVPLQIVNSSDVRVYNAYHHSLIQQTGSAFGVRVQVNALTNSTGIFLFAPVMINLRQGIVARNADLTIVDPLVIGDTTGGAVFGITAVNMLNIVIKNGYVTMPARSGVSLAVCVNVNGASVVVDGTVAAQCGQGFVVGTNKNARLSHVRAIQDPLSSPFLNAIQIGATTGAQNVILKEVEADCSGGVKGTDCVLFWNFRSLLVDGLTVVGSVPPLPGVYTGGMVSISSEFIPGGPPVLNFAAESIELNHVTIRMTDDSSLGLHINTGIMGIHTRNTTASVRHSTIKGGLVGVLLAGNARHVMLQSVTVADAPYCFVATNGTRSVTMKDCDAFSCCLGYWASPASQGIGVYNSHATTCGISYLNDGTNCELSTGFGSEGNNRILDPTGPFCNLPVLPFNPPVILLDINDTMLQQALAIRYGAADGEDEAWFSSFN